MIQLFKIALYTGLVICALSISSLWWFSPSNIYYLPPIHKLPEVKLQVKIMAVGDISLSRNVAAQIDKHNDPLFPFKSLDSLLKSTDLNIGNLESPFSGSEYYPPTGSLVFNAPTGNVRGLVEYNFKVLNIANNHALDQGVAGLKNTIEYLKEHNIQTIGAGESLTDAWAPLVQEINGIRMAFIGASYASINDDGQVTSDYIARIQDLDRLIEAVTLAKTQADVVIVQMHAGTEYVRAPGDNQVAFAHSAIDAGADIVIGHHPHWIQTIEKYNNKYIFYSLGNFIFDQMWSQETRAGLTLLLTIEKTKNVATISSIELMPVIIENYSTPRIATGEESERILGAILQSSKYLD